MPDLYDELIVPQLGTKIWRTRDLGGHWLRYEISESGHLVHGRPYTSHPIPYDGYIHIYGKEYYRHKNELAHFGVLHAKLMIEEHYRLTMVGGILFKLEQAFGDSWRAPITVPEASQILEAFHVTFPPLSAWRKKQWKL